MKKVLLFSALILATLIFLSYFIIRHNYSDSQETADESEAVTDSIMPDITTFTSEENESDAEEITEPDISEAQSLFTVDSWLKIYSIEKYNGNIALIAENISDKDVEFAVLTLKTTDAILTFNISALFSGTKAYLISETKYSGELKNNIISWKTDNRIDFAAKPDMNEDILAVKVENGSFSVKNITDSDITSDILVYYKEISNNLIDGSVTHRIRIKGLKSGALTYLRADGINNNNCKVIFTEYE